MLALMVAACAGQKVGEEGVAGPLIRVAVFGAGVWDMCRFIDGLLVGKNTWLEDRCMLVLVFCPQGKEEEEEEKEEEEEEEKEEDKEEEEEEEKEKEEGTKEENEAVIFLFNVFAGDIKTPCSARENSKEEFA